MVNQSGYLIRKLHNDETNYLDEFLYQAIFVPGGQPLPSRAVLSLPELSLYTKAFGSQNGDLALVAVVKEQLVGAIWVRFMKDYGYLDDFTPSLAMSVLPEYRGRGIGKALLIALLNRLKSEGVRQVSLSVQKENFAVNLYQDVGFTVHLERADDLLMVCKLS